MAVAIDILTWPPAYLALLVLCVVAGDLLTDLTHPPYGELVRRMTEN